MCHRTHNIHHTSDNQGLPNNPCRMRQPFKPAGQFWVHESPGYASLIDRLNTRYNKKKVTLAR